MNLAEQLATRRAESERSRSKAQINTMNSATEQLMKTGIEKSALGVGDTIPLFSLPNANGQIVAIKDLLNEGAVILTFYRGSWCPYCNLELRAYQQNLAKIRACGAQIVAVSPELPDKSLFNVPNSEKLTLDFEVLSDVGNGVASEFGLVFTLPNELAAVYRQLNSDITKHNGDDSWQLPLPATYVVGSDGKVVFSYVNADYLKRAEPEDVITALTKL